jgi:hypothetical protein
MGINERLGLLASAEDQSNPGPRTLGDFALPICLGGYGLQLTQPRHSKAAYRVRNVHLQRPLIRLAFASRMGRLATGGFNKGRSQI